MDDLKKSAVRFGEFVALMRDIGQLGQSTYGPNSLEQRLDRGELSRTARLAATSNMGHAAVHFRQAFVGLKHDHFDTIKHQLAAVAYNAFMEYVLLEEESACPISSK